MARAFAALLFSGLTACAASGPPPTNPPPVANHPSAAAAKSPALAQFLDVARKMSLTFETPPGYTEVAVRANEDQAYHYAIVSGDGRTEIRFTVLPFDLMPPEMRNKGMSLAFFMTGISNIVGADGKDGTFVDDPVSSDYFCADDAVMITMHWSKKTSRPAAFGYGYERGGAIFIHRKAVGVAYIFALFKDRAAVASLKAGTLNALRFAAP